MTSPHQRPCMPMCFLQWPGQALGNVCTQQASTMGHAQQTGRYRNANLPSNCSLECQKVGGRDPEQPVAAQVGHRSRPLPPAAPATKQAAAMLRWLINLLLSRMHTAAAGNRMAGIRKCKSRRPHLSRPWSAALQPSPGSVSANTGSTLAVSSTTGLASAGRWQRQGVGSVSAAWWCGAPAHEWAQCMARLQALIPATGSTGLPMSRAHRTPCLHL